jgi:hypothetical protein
MTVFITHVKTHTKSSQADFHFFFNYEIPVAMSYRQLTLADILELRYIAVAQATPKIPFLL